MDRSHNLGLALKVPQNVNLMDSFGEHGIVHSFAGPGTRGYGSPLLPTVYGETKAGEVTLYLRLHLTLSLGAIEGKYAGGLTLSLGDIEGKLGPLCRRILRRCFHWRVRGRDGVYGASMSRCRHQPATMSREFTNGKFHLPFLKIALG